MEKTEITKAIDFKTVSESLNNDGVLDQVIVTKGYDHGTVFTATDCATYTFLYENDVIALHFDLKRELLYIKGHKILNLNQHPLLVHFLQRFQSALLAEGVTKNFMDCFLRVMGRIA